jgi:hypothetical protein
LVKTRRRLGVLAIAVSGLLTAGLLFSAPAFAWSAHLKDVSASCPEGSEQPRVDFTLKFDTVRSGHIAVFVDDQQIEEVLNEADEADNTFQDVDHASFHFFLDNPGEDTTVTLKVVTFFDNSDEKSVDTKDVDVTKCEVEETTTTTETTETTATTAPPASTEAPSSSLGETSTTESGGALPFTGSNALPMLIAALVMVIGGLAAVYAGRIRGRHAK